MDNAPIKTYWSKDLAEHLNIGNSTLRKWSLELEKAGYLFLRDELGRRAYVEHDALALRKMKEYLDAGMSYDSAAKAITTDYLRKDSAEITLYANVHSPQEQRSDERYDTLEEKVDALTESNANQAGQIEQLIEMNKALFVRLDEQQAHIDRSLNARDAQLMAALREMQEERLQLAAAAEEEKNKSMWKRLFGGK